MSFRPPSLHCDSTEGKTNTKPGLIHIWSITDAWWKRRQSQKVTFCFDVEPQKHFPQLADSCTCTAKLFLPHDARLVRYMLWSSVRPSVCPSQGCVVSKWTNSESHKQRHTTDHSYSTWITDVVGKDACCKIYKNVFDWVKFYIPPDTNRSSRRQSSQPISWFSTKSKSNTHKQTCIHNKIYYNIKWTQKIEARFGHLLWPLAWKGNGPILMEVNK